jgi:hypothetical protein
MLFPKGISFTTITSIRSIPQRILSHLHLLLIKIKLIATIILVNTNISNSNRLGPILLATILPNKNPSIAPYPTHLPLHSPDRHLHHFFSFLNHILNRHKNIFIKLGLLLQHSFIIHALLNHLLIIQQPPGPMLLIIQKMPFKNNSIRVIKQS